MEVMKPYIILEKVYSHHITLLHCSFHSCKIRPWLRRLVSGLTPRRSGFDPRPVHLIFVMFKVALWHFSLPVLQFPLSVPFHQWSILIFIYMLLLQGQMGAAWEPSEKKQCFFETKKALASKVFLPLSDRLPKTECLTLGTYLGRIEGGL